MGDGFFFSLVLRLGRQPARASLRSTRQSLSMRFLRKTTKSWKPQLWTRRSEP